MFNPLHWAQRVDSKVARDAVARQAPLEQKIADAVAGRQRNLVNDYSARTDESVAPVIASYLSGQGNAADPEYQRALNLLRLQAMEGGAAQASPELIRSAMGQLEGDQARQALLEIVAGANARSGYGPAQAMGQVELGLNRALGRDDWLGGLSRAGLYGGIAGGGVAGVAGLTAAGQQLMALMQNMQQENANAEKREQGLM